MTRLIIAAGLAAAALMTTSLLAADQGESLADFQAAARQRLMQADTDHDGKLSQSEFAAGMAALRAGEGRSDRPDGARSPGGGGGRDPSRMFKMLDSNGDGFLDAAEIDAMSARRFARMDANGDGKVTAEEREAGRVQWRGRMGGGMNGMGGMGMGGGGWGQGDGDQGAMGGQPGD
jgi:hypothetical protein